VGLIGVFFPAVLGIFGAAISRQLTDEFEAWTPWLVNYLIQRALRQLPENQRKRREEEWLSHVDEIPGEVGKLIDALDFLRASWKISTALEQLMDTERRLIATNARYGRGYQPIPAELFRSCIRRIEVDHSSCAFVDLGCGKGRTLIIAAELGFAQVIGVEFARELADVAKHNLQKLNIGNATIIHGDAAEYQFPDSNLLLYMQNPFSADVMSKVTDRLGEFRAKHPHRQVFVIPARA
jgi:hypothetical protein